MHMRMTVNIDTKLFESAARLTGIEGKTALLKAALESLIAQAAARRLAALGGIDPTFKAPPRRRKTA
jgi:Arc/MetJ family transcription regulator